MNTHKNLNRSPIHSRIIIRLWLMMMFLIALSIVFMWVVQIFLFEKNYVNSSVAEVKSRLQPMIKELGTKDLADYDQLLSSLSKSTNGKMMLVDPDGKLIALYSLGYRLQDENSLVSIWGFLNRFKKSEEYQKVLQGETYYKMRRNMYEPIVLEIGIPVIYENKQALIVLYHSLDQLHTVLRMNRSQLVTLSITLSVTAALLAALLSRRFVRPIHIIKCTVDKLANGELTATPGLLLKDELGQLSDSVDELSKALQRVDILRKEVIANVSHELRSPLALIRGYAEMVRDINWKHDEKRNENLNLIIQEAGRMSEMVSDIMDYSQLQAGYMQLKTNEYNLYEIIESEVVHGKQNAAEFDIGISLDCSQKIIPVYVDAMKISQVVRNLLNNAVNHTAQGEMIRVVIDKCPDKVRVSVINPGEAIPEEDRTIIWERYQCSSQHSGRKKGTGIGLSIVSTYLKAHGMNYGVDCEGKFTYFWFECVYKDIFI